MGTSIARLSPSLLHILYYTHSGPVAEEPPTEALLFASLVFITTHSLLHTHSGPVAEEPPAEALLFASLDFGATLLKNTK